MDVGEFCRFGILTASDRASSGEYEDLSGPAIEGFLEEALTEGSIPKIFLYRSRFGK